MKQQHHETFGITFNALAPPANWLFEPTSLPLIPAALCDAIDIQLPAFNDQINQPIYPLDR